MSVINLHSIAVIKTNKQINWGYEGRATNLTSLPLCLVVVEIRKREIAVQVIVIETFTIPISRMIVIHGGSLIQIVMWLKRDLIFFHLYSWGMAFDGKSYKSELQMRKDKASFQTDNWSSQYRNTALISTLHNTGTTIVLLTKATTSIHKQISSI